MTSGVFIYGPPGAGKTTACRYLAEKHGFVFADGDAWLPEDMKESLRRKEGFCPEQRDRFTGILIERIGALSGRVAVAQALLMRRHRERVKRAHPGLLFVRAAADDDELRRRLQQGGNLVDDAEGARMNALLEVDDNDPVVYYRPNGPSVFDQLDSLLNPK